MSAASGPDTATISRGRTPTLAVVICTAGKDRDGH
jgi:hypothetical protein